MTRYPNCSIPGLLDRDARRPLGTPPPQEPQQVEDARSGRVRVTTATRLANEDPLYITPEILDRIEGLIGSAPAELGGVLGFRYDTGVISHFEFDGTADRTGVTYSPDVKFVNGTLKKWNAEGIRAAGFVHSHPRGARQPSHGDAIYSATLLRNLGELERLVLPIVQSGCGAGRFSIHGFFATRNGTDVATIDPAPIVTMDVAEPTLEHFDRVSDAVDVSWLSRCRLVVVGCGGSTSFCADLVRAGIGQVVLIDPDSIEATNVGTQDVRIADIGRPKVTALADRLIEVSDHVRVLGIHAGIEEIPPAQLTRLCSGSLPGLPAGPPVQTLICGFTDNFEAQAFVNRLALHVGVPMIAAGIYKNGAALELTFSAPGVTPACGRCVLGKRYRMYQNGFVNETGSAGSPFSATAHLNAMKQDLALALLQGTITTIDEDHPSLRDHPARDRARRLLHHVGNRNLLLVRRDPWVADSLGMSVFDRVLGGGDTQRLVYGDVVWLPEEAESPDTGHEPCPDCGGVGDLRAAIGAFDDLTRLDWTIDETRALAMIENTPKMADSSTG